MRRDWTRKGFYTSIPASREEVPPFFGGPAKTAIVMALARYGSMRLSQIEDAIGLKRRRNYTHTAVQELEAFGVVTRFIRGRNYVVTDLDRRHPAAAEIKAFGLALFEHYIAGSPKSEPPFERYPDITPDGPLDLSGIDAHLLGDDPPFRFMHLLAEGEWYPKRVLERWNGASHYAGYSIDYFEEIGVMESKRRKQSRYVRLNPNWFAADKLRALLLKLNDDLPEYKGMAKSYICKRRLKRFDFKFLVRQTRAYNRRVSEGLAPQKTADSPY